LNTFEGELSQEIERISDLSKTRAKFSSCFSRPLFIFYHIQKDFSWPIYPQNQIFHVYYNLFWQ
jgi:hypothetical protein